MSDSLKLRSLVRPPPTPRPEAQVGRGPVNVASPSVLAPQFRDTFVPEGPSGPNGPGGFGLDPESLDLLRYRVFESRGPPRREEFEDAYTYGIALDRWNAEREALQEPIADVLLEENQAASLDTPTGAALAEAAEAAGVEVVVLTDAEYDREHGTGSAGVTVDGDTVYVPVSSVDDPDDTNVIEHELVHVVLGAGLNPEVDQAEREARTAEGFAELELRPEAGAAVARETAGWASGEAADHVAAAFIRREIARQEAGLPPESVAQQEEVIARISDNELAKHLQGQLEKDPPLTDAELVEQYENSPTGQRYPPEGDTVEERAASVRAQMETFLEPDYVDPPAPKGPKFN